MVITNFLNNRKPSVLIVEDNEMDILVLKVLLEKHFNLYIVTNGFDALSALKEFVFDVILTDINLEDPKMNGIDLMKQIRTDDKTCHVKIFAITAYADNIEDMVNQGFNDVLIKPVLKEEIFEILNNSVLS